MKPAVLLMLAMLTAPTAVYSASPAKSQEETKGYSSPQDVFTAYRAVLGRGDWRAVFYCRTPQTREQLIADAWYGCNLKSHKPEVLALLKSYGVEQDAVGAEYLKRYRQKHGIDIAKLPAESQLPDVDHDLLREIVYAAIADKAAFYEAASKLVNPGEGEIGRLESLQVQNDTAVGRSSRMMYTLHNDGRGWKRTGTAVPVTFRFHRVRGGWLIERPD